MQLHRRSLFVISETSAISSLRSQGRTETRSNLVEFVARRLRWVGGIDLHVTITPS